MTIMAHEPFRAPNPEAYSESSSAGPHETASRLPGTSPDVDEALGRQMEREQRMYQVAEQIGTVLGRAVHGVRGISDRVRQGIHVVGGQAREHAESATDTAADLAQSMSERITSLRHEAAQTAAQWRDKAGQRAGELNQLAEQRIAEARSRAERASRESPLQMIVGLAAASFIIGFGLRLWRSHRG